MQPGSVIERYRIQGQIGSGGMGTVYLATHMVLGSQHAIKVVSSPEQTRSARLLEEARVQARLHHPNILPVTDLLTTERGAAVVLEYVPNGLTLRRVLAEQSLSIESIDGIGRGIMAGVNAAHSHRLLHRDLKPANILMRRIDGRLEPVIADFGLAQFLDVREADRPLCRPATMGTPGYASPEQLRGETDLDERTDIFALGATLYELVTGLPAFGGANVHERRNRTYDGYYVSPSSLRSDAPQRMHDAINAALATDRRQRTASVQELLDLWTGRRTHIARVVEWEGAHPELALFIQNPDDQALQEHLERCNRCVRLVKDYKRHIASAPETLTDVQTPATSSGFVGRHTALQILRERLVLREERLVTVKGPGGVGKSRLAMRLAELHRGVFTGGVFSCDLGSASSTDDVLRLLRALVTGAPAGADAERQLLEALHARGRCLVILDNTEHLAQPVAELLSRWQQRAPRVQWLLTSRVPLNATDEWVFSLEPLSEDDSVELFRSCAARQSDTMPLPIDAEPTIRAIVGQLDGLPLAIEMAAARLRVFSPSQLLERLGDRLRVLRKPGASGHDRHATLRATLAWSWSLLNPDARELLAQCSVFPAGFSLELLEGVADLQSVAPDAWLEDVLQSLIDASLVHSVPTEERPRWFRLLDSVRDFARHELEKRDPTGAARDRYILHFAHRLPLSPRPHEEEKWFAAEPHWRQHRVSAVRALEWALEHASPVSIARCFLQLSRQMEEDEQWRWAEDVFERVQPTALDDREVGITIGVRHAAWLSAQAKPDEAHDVLVKLLDEARALGLRAVEARVDVMLARIQMKRGHLEEAEAGLWRARQLDQQRGARFREVGVLNLLGAFYVQTKRAAEAARCLEASLSMSRAIGAHRSESISHCWLGLLARHHDELQRAQVHFERAVETSRRDKQPHNLANSLVALGRYHAKCGDPRVAQKALVEARGLLRELGSTEQLRDIEPLLEKLDDRWMATLDAY